ncbi:MAG: rRNA maturation RNase YbeY [Clostridia bacterium]|nr:rRNA maturation RNase YbeY [Clostridia bacterium]
MKVKVNITIGQKGIAIDKEARALIRKACSAVLKYEQFVGDAEVDVTVVGDEKIHEINLEHRNIDSPTDVLSFPLGEDGIYDKNPMTDAFMLGDIVISTDRAKYQADLYGHSIEREIAFLTVHSMLHLLGYDHVNGEEERAIMREKEEAVLEIMGLAIKKD